MRKNEKRKTPRARAAGFTLLEVILAMMILGMCLGGILYAMSDCLKVARQARIYDTTRDLLSRVEAENPIETVEEFEDIAGSGSFDDPKLQGYSWKREYEPVMDEKYGLYKITTTISWSDNDKESSEQIVTYRYSQEMAQKAMK